MRLMKSGQGRATETVAASIDVKGRVFKWEDCGICIFLVAQASRLCRRSAKACGCQILPSHIFVSSSTSQGIILTRRLV